MPAPPWTMIGGLGWKPSSMNVAFGRWWPLSRITMTQFCRSARQIRPSGAGCAPGNAKAGRLPCMATGTFHAVDRRRLVLPFYDRSEFAGLSLEGQSKRCGPLGRCFRRKASAQPSGSHPRIALIEPQCRPCVPKRLSGSSATASPAMVSLRTIFSGYPSNFGRLRTQRRAVDPCLHPNGMSLAHMDRLGGQLSTPYYRERTVSVADVKLTRRRRSALDDFYAWTFWNRGRVVNQLLLLRQAISPKKTR